MSEYVPSLDAIQAMVLRRHNGGPPEQQLRDAIEVELAAGALKMPVQAGAVVVDPGLSGDYIDQIRTFDGRGRWVDIDSAGAGPYEVVSESKPGQSTDWYVIHEAGWTQFSTTDQAKAVAVCAALNALASR